MAAKTNRVEALTRVIAITKTIRDNPQSEVSAIAKQTKAHPRTIRRDLDALIELGIVEAEFATNESGKGAWNYSFLGWFDD